MPQPNSKSLHAQIATLNAEVGMMRELAEEAGRNRKTAEAERDQARADCAALKKLLAEAREESARLNGYIRRVHESDAADSDRVEIERAPAATIAHGRRHRSNPPRPAYRGTAPERQLLYMHSHARQMFFLRRAMGGAE